MVRKPRLLKSTSLFSEAAYVASALICITLMQGAWVSEQTMIKGGGRLDLERAKKYFFVTLPFM